MLDDEEGERRRERGDFGGRRQGSRGKDGFGVYIRCCLVFAIIALVTQWRF